MISIKKGTTRTAITAAIVASVSAWSAKKFVSFLMCIFLLVLFYKCRQIII